MALEIVASVMAKETDTFVLEKREAEEGSTPGYGVRESKLDILFLYLTQNFGS